MKMFIALTSYLAEKAKTKKNTIVFRSLRHVKTRIWRPRKIQLENLNHFSVKNRDIGSDFQFDF